MRAAGVTLVVLFLLSGCAGPSDPQEGDGGALWLPRDADSTPEDYANATLTPSVKPLDADDDLAILVESGAPRFLRLTANKAWTISVLQPASAFKAYWILVIPVDYLLDVPEPCGAKETKERYTYESGGYGLYYPSKFADIPSGDYELHVGSDGGEVAVYFNDARPSQDRKPKAADTQPSEIEMRSVDVEVQTSGNAPVTMDFDTNLGAFPRAHIDFTFRVSGTTKTGASKIESAASYAGAACFDESRENAATQAYSTTLDTMQIVASTLVKGEGELQWQGHYEASAGDYLTPTATALIIEYPA